MNGQQYQNVGGKVYSQDQLNTLQKELKGSHFKPVDNSQNDVNNKNNVQSVNSQNNPDLLNKPVVANSLNSNNNVNNANSVKINEKLNALPERDGVHKETVDVKPSDTVQHVPKADVVNENVIDAGANNNKGVFNIADQPKDNSDIFDPKANKVSDQAGIPAHVKFIDGDVEKDRRNNEIIDPVRDERRSNDVLPSNARAPMQQDNYNFNNGVVNHDGGGVQHEQADEPDEKPGSMKVVWDWSDFAVNFEQYIMPEQKIRRAHHATTGEPWPMPQYYITKNDKVYSIDKVNFRFDLAKSRCEIIEKAIKRYKPYILEDAVEDMYDNFQHAQSTMFEDPSLKYETPLYLDAPLVSKVYLKIRKPCAKMPTAKSDESCKYCFTYN